MRGDGLAHFVADTHALLWRLYEPHRVSAAARAAFRLVDTEAAVLWIPAIVLAELDYACAKHRLPSLVSSLIEWVNGSSNVRVADLGAETLLTFAALEAPSEMHNRLIAAEALRRRAPVITRDPALREAGVVETIW